MDSSLSLKDQIRFLRVCHHVSNILYRVWNTYFTVPTNKTERPCRASLYRSFTNAYSAILHARLVLATVVYCNRPVRRPLQIWNRAQRHKQPYLTLILLTWRIWWAPNNASRLQMGFNLAFRGLKLTATLYTSVSQPLWDRSQVNSFSIRRRPGPNRFTRKYLSIFFKFIH